MSLGSVHCATPFAYFEQREVNGVKLADWTQALVEGEAPPDSQACEGDASCDDPVCDACADLEGGDEPWCRYCGQWPPAWSDCDDPP